MRAIKFHQGFKFDRTRLSTLLHYMGENKVATKKSAATYMGVGLPAAEGCIGWMQKTNLAVTRSGGYSLTGLGQLLSERDPHLNHPSTLWLLHYYLATDHAERAEIWYRAVNEFLSPGVPFQRNGLQTYIERSLESTPTNRSGISADCIEFIKTYTIPDALGKLGLLRKRDKDTFEAGTTDLPHPSIIAFYLFETWQRRFPHSDTLRISQICEDAEMPGRVLVTQRSQIIHALQMLQSMGMVSIVDSQHEPVTRRFRNEPIQIISDYYASL